MAARKRHAGTGPAKAAAPAPPKPRSETPAPPAPTKLWDRWWLPPAALLVLVGALFARSLSFPYYYLDDVIYLTDPRLDALSLSNLWRILSTSFLANYHPVTTLTYAVDRAVYGAWLPGFHLTHLLFYATGVLVVYYWLRSLLHAALPALAAASLFAVHTTHVEVVAWLAQRKDLVCLVFYVGAVLAYAAYTRASASRRQWLYLLLLALAALAMLSKGYAVVLPGVLVAYDLCFGERLGRRQLLDKVPVVLLAAATTVVTFFAQDKDSALAPADAAPIPIIERLGAVTMVFAGYVGRALLPIRLSLSYNIGPSFQSLWMSLLGAALAVGVVVGFFWFRRRLPEAAFGLALFVLPLATVMNLFWTLGTWMNDRYLFLPTVGSSLAIVAVWRWGVARWGGALRPFLPLAGGVLLVSIYALLTVSRLGVWQSELLLRSDAMRKQLRIEGEGPLTAKELRAAGVRQFPDLHAFIALQAAFKREGRSDDAKALRAMVGALTDVGDSETALELAEDDIAAGRYDEALTRLQAEIGPSEWHAHDAWRLIGEVREKQGNLDLARQAYESSLARAKASGLSGTAVLLKLGDLEANAQRLPEAERWLRLARESATARDPRPACQLAAILEKRGDVQQAYGLYREVVDYEGHTPPTLKFDFADVHAALGLAADKLGRRDEAMVHLREAIRRTDEPTRRGELQMKVGLIAEQAGKNEEALADLTETLRLVPAHAERATILLRMAEIEEKLGRHEAATTRLQSVLDLAPNHPERAGILLKLGQLAEKRRDWREAVSRYEQGLLADPRYPDAAAVRARITQLQAKLDGPGGGTP